MHLLYYSLVHTETNRIASIEIIASIDLFNKKINTDNEETEIF